MSKEINRHVVLISGSASDSKSVAAIMSAMRITGAIPLLIADHHEHLADKDNAQLLQEQAQRDLAKADGLVLMGNDWDIDPADYGSATRHPQTRSERQIPGGTKRADYEYFLVEEVLAQKKPFFGVCGGMQRLNVFLKGTLHQHVPDLVGTSYHQQADMGIAPFIPVQYVGVVPGTRLAAIGKEIGGIFTPQHDDLPPGVFMENSFHHQAIDKVGDGLIPCAFSIEPDKPDIHIVQAIESNPQGPYGDQFLLGVQWHPEFGASDLSIRSMQNFTSAAQDYAIAHPREMSSQELLSALASGAGINKSKLFSQTSSLDWLKEKGAQISKKPTGKSR